MINAKTALQYAQTANRNNWLKAAEARLNDLIIPAASTGMKFITVEFNDLIIGAETLPECAEMLVALNNTLNEKGFTVTISPNGILTIIW